MIKRRRLLIPLVIIASGLWLFIVNLTPFLAGVDSVTVNPSEATSQEKPQTVSKTATQDSEEQVSS